MLGAEFHDPGLGPKSLSVRGNKSTMAAVPRGDESDKRILSNRRQFEGRKRHHGIVLRRENQRGAPDIRNELVGAGSRIIIFRALKAAIASRDVFVELTHTLHV